MENKIKCITFDKAAQDALPEDIKAKMKADREKAQQIQKPAVLKYSAFIENTIEMREWLEGLGYEPFEVETKLENPNHYRKILAFVDEYWYTLASDNVGVDSKTGKRMAHVLDCRSNPDLFKAITPMRNDSDIYQWFTDGLKWVISDIHNLNDLEDYFKEIDFNYLNTHKATLDELLEHFKNNQSYVDNKR